MPDGKHPQIESRMEESYVAGKKRIIPSEINIGSSTGKLFVFKKLDEGADVPEILKAPIAANEKSKEAKAILERARRPLSEFEIIDFYNSELPFQVEVGNDKFSVPFACAEIDQYLLHPERVAGMDFEVRPQFEIDPQLRAYKEKLIGFEIAAGRRLSDNDITSVGAYDETHNIVGVRNVRYLDIATTNNLGLDVRFSEITNEPMMRDGVSYETLRQLESPAGRLRPLSESLLANVLGIGGILITRDGHLVIPQRKIGAGVASLDGTYGLTASGNAEWDERRLDEVGIQEHLGGKMRKEIKEELGLRAKKKGMNLSRYLLRNIESYVKREVGLDTSKGEVQITPMAFSRDLIRGGLPQMFYLFQTPFDADEIPERMAMAEDGKKEYNQVVTLPLTVDLIQRILGNKIEGMKFNQELRAAIAYAWASKEVRELAKEK